jgi:hypothetical protein
MVENNIKNSLNSLLDKDEKRENEMSKEEEIGFHKGSLNTLAAERNELVKMVMNVDSIMQAHVQRLKELGVELGKK